MKSRSKLTQFKQILPPLLLALALLVCLCPQHTARAQGGVLRFDHLTVEDGLYQNTVGAVLQDRWGFMWFGTEDGLHKYDGYSFTVYQHAPDDPESLSSSNILALYEDSRVTLWIGTDAGLDSYDRTREKFTHYQLDPASAVTALVEDSEGRVWAGTDGSGIWVFQEDGEIFTRFQHDPGNSSSLPSDHIRKMLRDRNGRIWVATDEGIASYDGISITLYRHDLTNPNSPTSNDVTALLEDRAGELWIGTNGGGLNRLDPQTGVFTFYLPSNVDPNSLKDGRVHALLEDGNGMLWIGTPLGLDSFDPERKVFTHFSRDARNQTTLSANEIKSLYEDRSGIIWIGTNGGGLSLYKPEAHKFKLFQVDPFSENGLSGNQVTSFAEEASGRLWVGTADGGLNRLTLRTGEWKYFRHDGQASSSLSSDQINALWLDTQGYLWVGTAGSGLDRFDPLSGISFHFRYDFSDPSSISSNNITSLVGDEDGNLWIGTLDRGLNLLKSGQTQFAHYRYDPADPSSMSDDAVMSLYLDRAGSLWVGTWTGGLNRLLPGEDTFEHFQHMPGDDSTIASDSVLSILEAYSGDLWVGTRGGLDRLNPRIRQFTHYSTKEGLPGDYISGILEDEQRMLWVSTTAGLAQLDPESGNFRVYSPQDGLQSREFNSGAAFRSQRGELYFGGVQGFNAFFPGDVFPQESPPPIAITAFKKQNEILSKELTGEQPVRLSYRDNNISFEFAALDYNAPEKNTYAYMLEGSDDDWIEAGSRNYVTYSNLKGGEYMFRVRAASSGGAWNESGIAVPLVVTPPVWETTWFQILAVLGFVGIGFGGYFWRTSSIRRRNLELERRVTELSQEVEEAAVAVERNRLARDLHDSVTQSLYSLTLLTEAGQRMIASGDREGSIANQERLSEIAQQALQEMRLMVYNLRSPDLEKTGIAGALEHRLEAVERRAGVTARLSVEQDLSLTPGMQEELFQLAQEALNNALKHAASNAVLVRLWNESGHIVLEVEDNGRGFDQDKACGSGGLGLISMRERAEKLGGRLSIRSSPGKGTCVRFDGPVIEEDTAHEKIRGKAGRAR